MKVQSLASSMLFCAVAGQAALTNAAYAATQAAAVAADAKSTVHFTVFLPLTRTTELDQLLLDQVDPTSENYHHWLTPSQFKQQFGPDRSVVAKAKAALKADGFSVVSEKTQSLEVTGSVSAVQKAFSTRLLQQPAKNGTTVFSAADQKLSLPASLKSLGAIVPEFASHQEMHVHSSRGKALASAGPAERLSDSESLYYPNDLKEAYLFPSFVTEATPKGGSGPVQIPAWDQRSAF